MLTSQITITSNSHPFEESHSIKKIGELHNIWPSNRLNGKNYLKWSQFIQTYIKGKGRLSHLLELGLTKDDLTIEAWDNKDSTIMPWLWDSMDSTVNDTCMFFNTTKEF
jgi:hypothetical protein